MNNGSTPLPEAPASATMKIEYRGYEVLFTLRDHSGYKLIEKVEKAIDVLEGLGATPASSKRGGRKSKSQYIEAPTDGSAPRCPVHNAPMKASNYGGNYCSRKDEAGNYCSYKSK